MPYRDPLVILVATMSGTAEMVADELATSLLEAQIPARILRMERANLATLERHRDLIICSSTYGTGDPPENGRAFYELLHQARPDLSPIRYGVVALGDRTYSATFCGGGAKFDALFASLGAQRLIPRMEHDARSGIYPEEAALEWLQGYLGALEAEMV